MREWRATGRWPDETADVTMKPSSVKGAIPLVGQCLTRSQDAGLIWGRLGPRTRVLRAAKRASKGVGSSHVFQACARVERLGEGSRRLIGWELCIIRTQTKGPERFTRATSSSGLELSVRMGIPEVSSAIKETKR